VKCIKKKMTIRFDMQSFSLILMSICDVTIKCPPSGDRWQREKESLPFFFSFGLFVGNKYRNKCINVGTVFFVFFSFFLSDSA
jgi:hypothetical protein